MKILLLGGTSQIGKEFCALPQSEDIQIMAPGRDECDLTKAAQTESVLDSSPWDVVINTAAYTDVDGADSHADLAFKLNAEAAGSLAVQTARRGLPLIHISTDYVFDGRKGSPYVEEDLPNPVNVYGRSKLAGEEAIRRANPRHVILRSSWVFSPHNRNFVTTMLDAARQHDRLRIINDQRGCPTAARDIALACQAIAMRIGSAQAASYGVFHFAGGGEATWFDFAGAIFEMASARGLDAPVLTPVSSADYGVIAARPPDSRLNSSAIRSEWGIAARPWKDSLSEMLSSL